MEVPREYIDNDNNTIVRHVTVERDRDREQFCLRISRRQFVDNAVLATMPNDGPAEVDVVFFKVGRYLSVNELEGEYESRGLKPDHYAQIQANIDDPAFADEHPNGTQ